MEGGEGVIIYAIVTARLINNIGRTRSKCSDGQPAPERFLAIGKKKEKNDTKQTRE
jgi:hypothetical protein